MAEPLPRKLAAILYADVAGYSRLTGEDEDVTHRILREYLDLIASIIESHRGQVMHYAGDAVLARFGAASDALTSAVTIQSELRIRNEALPEERRVRFRIGVNSGDVIEDRGDIYGDGVNVAARLETLAEPGGICISESIRTAVGKRLPLAYESLGEQSVKNIADPVRAYRVQLDARTRPGVSAPPVSGSKMPSLAVLPFTNMSGDPTQDYFSDGITEDITTALSNVGSFSVTARHSAFAYKDKAIDVRRVGKALGVQYVVEGSVRRSGDKVRVTAQLIDAITGQHIWANRYEGTVADIFEFQDRITETIVGTLEPEFERAESQRIAHKRPHDMQAYDYLLQGMAYMHKVTPEDTAIALGYFRKALEKDPGYSRAYAYASDCYRRRVNLTGMTLSEQERDEAVRLMAAALKANPDDPVVLWQAASMNSFIRRDFEAAVALIERSLSIDPNSGRAWMTSAAIHSYMGDTRTAIEHAERALRISPRNPVQWIGHTHMAAAYMQECRYRQAVEAAKKAIQLNDKMIPAYLILAASSAHLGLMNEARGALNAALSLNPGLTVGRLPTLYAIARYRNLDGYLEGLRKAGLPE
ncbi:MAG TPA: adenylate/guanylate cyclase domain-containing protein [Gammaproteobacteria bacterium]|nr:adenylate/guanylate cyclase domain-containing protein [Gammaproteobacteria bacterium]